jgi:predicted permease
MRDLRYAVRVLWKAPVFTGAVVLTLALCIGANTAIFTVVDRVLLRPLPYPQPDRLIQVITYSDEGGEQSGQTGTTWEALRDNVTTLDLAVTVGGSQGVNLVAHDRPEYVKQHRISAGFFRVLGVAPEIGREFTADEDRPNGPAVAVLSHPLWMRLFNGDRTAIGRAITLRGEPVTIIGVMPAAFTSGTPADVWTPVRPCRTCEGGGHNYRVVGRLKSGMTPSRADVELLSIGDPILRTMYRGNSRVHLRVQPLQRAQTDDVRQPLVILWAAVGVVLLIGCVNIAGLLLARASARGTEIATRIAIGGSRSAIVRQLLAESVVLAACGGICGIAVGYASSRLFGRLLQDAFGVAGEIGLDARVLTICGASALVTSVVFGLVPALQASRVNLRETLVESGSNAVAGAARSWPRRALVVVEVALGVMLLVGAGLLLRTFEHLMNLRAGFDSAHVMTATLSLQDARYRSAAKVNQLFDRTIDNMRRVAGVENAAVCLTLPYERALNEGARWIGNTSGSDVIGIMNQTYVTPGYFDTLRIPVIRGRVFTEADTASGRPVIVVNQAFVRKYSADVDPIGRQMGSPASPRTIVGVVGDIQQQAGWGSFGPLGTMAAAYIPAAQTSDAFLAMVHTWFSPNWVVRMAGPQQGVAAAMQHAVQSVDPLLPFAKFRTLEGVRGETVAKQRAQAVLLGSLATLALLLAAIGLYGLVANSVADRTRELGIRIALGATPAATVRVAATPGIAFGAVGVAIGLALARTSSSVLGHLVWGITVSDPLTYLTAAVVVMVVATLAALVPSLRILKLNPIRALRQT